MKKKLNIITWIIIIGLIIFTYNIIREKTIDVIGTKVKILDDTSIVIKSEFTNYILSNGDTMPKSLYKHFKVE